MKDYVLFKNLEGKYLKMCIRDSQNSEDPADLTELSTEKTYKVTEQDLGFVLVLKIAGKEDMGFSGSLTASTKPVACLLYTSSR